MGTTTKTRGEGLFIRGQPTPGQHEYLDEIKEQVLALMELVERLPESRFRSICFTKIEESALWAEKAVLSSVGRSG